MTNRRIRKDAWALYKANFPKLLPAMVLLQLMIYAPSILIGRSSSGGLMGLLATQISTMLFAPITLFGAAAFSLDVLRGGEPQTSLMFSQARDLQTTLKMWLAALVYYGSALVLNVAAQIPLNTAYGGLETYVSETGMAFLAIALFIAVIVVEIWLTLRLWLISYVAVTNPEAGAFQWMKTSWRAMKGNCGRQMRMVISVFWPSVAFTLLFTLIAERGASLGSISLQTLSNLIFSCFYMGYPLLALAGLADDILKENQRF